MGTADLTLTFIFGAVGGFAAAAMRDWHRGRKTAAPHSFDARADAFLDGLYGRGVAPGQSCEGVTHTPLAGGPAVSLKGRWGPEIEVRGPAGERGA